MFELWGMTLSRDALSMLLDVLLIVIMLALWWLWWQQGKHRKDIETKLLDAGQQLKEATLLLDDALQRIGAFQEQELGDSSHANDRHVEDVPQPKAQAYRDVGDKDAYSPRGKKVVDKAVFKPAPKTIVSNTKSTDAAQILRMQREGESPESIARNMNMPLAQVKLMLMLHKQND